MATTAYQVMAIRKDGIEIDLRITLLNPDFRRIYTTNSFLFMVLSDGERTISGSDGPMSEMAESCLEEPRSGEGSLFRTAAAKVVRSGRIVKYDNYSRKKDWDAMDLPPDEADALFDDRNNLPTATVRVIVTDPEWLKEIKLKRKWFSYAYSVEHYYGLLK